MPVFTCTGCGGECESEDSYSDCCNEPAVPSSSADPDGYDRNGAYDGFQVTSDAEGGL